MFIYGIQCFLYAIVGPVCKNVFYIFSSKEHADVVVLNYITFMFIRVCICSGFCFVPAKFEGKKLYF